MVIEHPGTTTGSATIAGIMLFKDHTFRIKIQAEVNLLSNESQKLMVISFLYYEKNFN